MRECISKKHIENGVTRGGNDVGREAYLKRQGVESHWGVLCVEACYEGSRTQRIDYQRNAKSCAGDAS